MQNNQGSCHLAGRTSMTGVGLILCLALILACFMPALRAAAPANPDLNEAGRKVLDYLHRLKEENKTMAGQHVYLGSSPREHRHMKDVTGSWPAVFGFDLLGFHKNPDKRRTYLQLAKKHWEAGGLVSISWHETSPVLKELDQGGYSKGTKKKMSDAEFKKVVTPGTTLHKRWMNHLDLAAQWLKQLQEDGVVVLWRPYHELTGGWFWWGAKDPEQFKKLWRMMFRRFTEHHELDNLIWVWSAAQRGSKEQFRRYFPADYVDVGGVDIYRTSRDTPDFTERYSWAQNAAGDRPVALTEVGLLPSADIFTERTRYVWFLTWGRGFADREHYGKLEKDYRRGNSPEILREVYGLPSVITRGELPDFQK